MNEEEDTIKRLIKMIQETASVWEKLPDPPEHVSADKVRWQQAEEVECLCCQKYIHISECQKIDTGYIKALDAVCASCRKEFSGTCPIVCVPCKSVVSRMKPHKDKSGFTFEVNKAYHTDRCPSCSPNCQTSFLVEKAAHDKNK